MSPLDNVAAVLVLLFAAFVPTLLALLWLRSGERGRKERWEHIIPTYLFGAVVAAVFATALELVATTLLDFVILREYEFFVRNPSTATFLLIIVIAPLVEELAKVLGVIRFSSRYIWRPRNGLVFGAASGLGFAATENFLYESTALFQGGYSAFLAVALIRSFSSTLMHASASSIAGYGVARAKVYGGRWWPYFGIAVLMHASFNLFASFGELFEGRLGSSASLFGLLFSLVLVFAVVLYLRWRIGGYNA